MEEISAKCWRPSLGKQTNMVYVRFQIIIRNMASLYGIFITTSLTGYCTYITIAMVIRWRPGFMNTLS